MAAWFRPKTRQPNRSQDTSLRGDARPSLISKFQLSVPRLKATVIPLLNAPKKTLFHLVPFLCFVISLVVWLGSLLQLPLPRFADWAENLFPIFALATTLTTAARALPAQNVILAAVLIAAISGIIETVGAKTGIPFGPFVYTDNLGPKIFGVLPWPVPIIWVVAIFNSRGVARLILRPWRKVSKYGFWAIGLTCALVVILDFALEPFCSLVNRYWIWHAPDTVPAWHTAPWVNFFSWATTTLLILAFTTPWLINKRHNKHTPPDYYPLIVWVLLIVFQAAGNAAHHLWSAAVLSLLASIVVVVFAVRGARW